jgi:membrane protease YdiL (CAAX protease family)
MTTSNTHQIQSYLDWADQGKASIWRYGLGSVLLVIIFFMLSGIGMIPLVVFVPGYKESVALSALALFMSFIISFFAIPLLVKFLHQRPAWSVAMPRLGFDAWNFVTGFWVATVIALVSGVVFSLVGMMPLEANPDFSWGTVIVVGLIGLVGIFIQAGSEEMLFRGYFTQFTRRFTTNKYLFLGIPALLFAVPHLANISAFGGGILVLVPYFISGVLYGWAAYRTGSLWLGLALHLSNNWTGLVFVGTKGDVLPSAAPFQIEVPSLTIAIVAVAVQSLLIAVALEYLIKRREARPSA